MAHPRIGLMRRLLCRSCIVEMLPAVAVNPLLADLVDEAIA
jgi:hypothetical protein